jgi:hypothetical protein
VKTKEIHTRLYNQKERQIYSLKIDTKPTYYLSVMNYQTSALYSDFQNSWHHCCDIRAYTGKNRLIKALFNPHIPDYILHRLFLSDLFKIKITGVVSPLRKSKQSSLRMN